MSLWSEPENSTTRATPAAAPPELAINRAGHLDLEIQKNGNPACALPRPDVSLLIGIGSDSELVYRMPAELGPSLICLTDK